MGSAGSLFRTSCVLRPLFVLILPPPRATPRVVECGFSNDGLPGTAEVPVANTQPLATWLCLPQPVGQSRGACLGSRSETTPDRLHSHGLLLHGIVCREGIEEQSMHGVDASKLLHGFIRIEHRAVGVIKSMS